MLKIKYVYFYGLLSIVFHGLKLSWKLEKDVCLVVSVT